MSAFSSTFLLPNRLHSSSTKLPARPFKASYAYSTMNQTRAPVSTSLYEVLGVPENATCHDIKVAYRKLARTCHPDVVAVRTKDSSASEFMKVHEAYSTLSDPDRRATYDYGLYGRSVRGSFPTPSVAAASARVSGFTRKKWETDQCW